MVLFKNDSRSLLYFTIFPSIYLSILIIVIYSPLTTTPVYKSPVYSFYCHFLFLAFSYLTICLFVLKHSSCYYLIGCEFSWVVYSTFLALNRTVFLLRELNLILECWLITLFLLNLGFSFAFVLGSGYLGSQVKI